MIVEERQKNGPYASVEDFRSRLPARNVNRTVMGKLEAVGAFADIEPGAAPASCETRREAQLQFIPDVMLGGAVVTRALPTHKSFRTSIRDALTDKTALSSPVFEGAPFVMPRYGKTPWFMAVADGPASTEAKARKMTQGKSFSTLQEILDDLGMDVNDGYWTSLCKIPKTEGEKVYSHAQIAANAPLLRRELEILKPQVVLTLGTAAMRFFEPKMKGGCQDNAGKIIYRPETAPGARDDFNLVIGITPGMLYFDPSRSELLVNALQTVKEMVG